MRLAARRGGEPWLSGTFLGLSGGKDSAALAVHMRQAHPELDIEYFFTDTGKELPEVYEFLGRSRAISASPSSG